MIGVIRIWMIHVIIMMRRRHRMVMVVMALLMMVHRMVRRWISHQQSGAAQKQNSH